MLRCRSTRPPRCPRLPFSAAGLVLALMSCAPWASIPTPAPGALPPGTRLQVWIGHRAMVLRDVRISVDSIRGRAVDPLGAPSAAWLVVPRAEVDSFRIRPPDRDNWFGAGVAAGLLSGIVGTLAFCRAAAGD
jgi:hypothetical protein